MKDWITFNRRAPLLSFSIVIGMAIAYSIFDCEFLTIVPDGNSEKRRDYHPAKIADREITSVPLRSKSTSSKAYVDIEGRTHDVSTAISHILAGESLLEYLPGKSDAVALHFYHELHSALKKDLQNSLDYSKVKRVFDDLNSQQSGIGGEKGGFLVFLASLETDMGPSEDLFQKVSILKGADIKLNPFQSERVFRLLGAKKAPGSLSKDSLRNLNVSEMKSFVLGMGDSGDLFAIDALLNYSEGLDKDLLEMAVHGLMETDPGKSIAFIDNLGDPVIRNFCLKIAVDSVRKAGAHTDADEWEKVLDRDE